jgi:hypothetical protein
LPPLQVYDKLKECLCQQRREESERRVESNAAELVRCIVGGGPACLPEGRGGDRRECVCVLRVERLHD